MIIWQPGQQINNSRFIIQSILGTGGFGITYKALEPSTGKLYAIKTLNSTMQLREDFGDQQVKFINEALTIKGFDHKYILKVYEVIQEGQLFGVVMEYIDGVTLFKYVQNKGQLSENEALLYIDQIGQALEYIHNKGQLHRDIKPENILLRQNKQEAVLIDFGLTRSLATKSMTNALTEGFAPIEQYRRKGNFGPHTDVYALAATLYYLLTANGLKQEGEICPVPAVNRKYDDEPLPEPKHYNSRISQRVNNAILQGMEIEPEKRTPTALKFRESLGLVIKPVTPLPPPIPTSQPQPRQKQNILTPQSVKTVRLPQRENSSSFLSKIKEIFIPQSSTPQPVNQDYTKLCDLLKAGKWKEADEETRRVMFAVAKREKEGWLDPASILNFPCTDLRTIDQLWLKYSSGKFGFSVQKRIYQGLGGTSQHFNKTWEKFGDQVGWKKKKLLGIIGEDEWLHYKDITFDIKAPEGHLPGGGADGGCWGNPYGHWQGGGSWLVALLSRPDL
ncbi:serine/threonine-protein kinase [Sphaerospermopsis torques-reginae]|uniref:serine/threonine-protein kinase n=1 Tax=Sphaerospermopsis torques-reginae TaxID=984207 RepID=UPI001FECF0C1|nr:serine/threonine-protein kinase [Sphaerospermopsis torques-reginae]